MTEEEVREFLNFPKKDWDNLDEKTRDLYCKRANEYLDNLWNKGKKDIEEGRVLTGDELESSLFDFIDEQ